MDVKDVIEVLAILLIVGLAAEVLADVVRLPRMVFLLAAGVLVGPEVLEWIDVPLDGLGPQLLFSLGVSLILFYGGLELSLRVLSRVGIGLVLLAVPGVVITALVVGAAAALAFDLPFEQGFLIGAVVAPTDPAILIPLFERLRVRPKVVQTVVAESALNDPTGAVLAITIAAFILGGEGSVAGAAAVSSPISDSRSSSGSRSDSCSLRRLGAPIRNLARVAGARRRARRRGRLRVHRLRGRQRLPGRLRRRPHCREQRVVQHPGP